MKFAFHLHHADGQQALAFLAHDADGAIVGVVLALLARFGVEALLDTPLAAVGT